MFKPKMNKGISLRILLLFFSFLYPISLSYCESAPAIRLKFEGLNLLKLSIKISTKNRLFNSRLQLERKVDADSKFKRIANIRLNRKNIVNYIDHINKESSLLTYRSRLTGSLRSSWGELVSASLILDGQGNVVSALDENGEALDGALPAPVDNSTPNDPPIVLSTPGDILEVVLPTGFLYCPREALIEAFQAVNSSRSANGLYPLVEEVHLLNSSRNFSAKMAINSNLSHDGWFSNILAWGFNGSSLGQNIGFMPALSAPTMIEYFLESPHHRSNILSANYKFLGLGCVLDPRGYAWWTQDFGA